MAASTSHDLWLCYQRYMDLHCRAQDLPIRNLMHAEARTCLDLWFKAIERELRTQAYEGDEQRSPAGTQPRLTNPWPTTHQTTR